MNKKPGGSATLPDAIEAFDLALTDTTACPLEPVHYTTAGYDDLIDHIAAQRQRRARAARNQA